MLGRLTDSFLKKCWSDEDVKRYVGDYVGTYLTYACNEDVREKSASGGTTTALLIHGLKNNDFDGAVVCKAVIRGGKVRAEFCIATTEQEVLSARGSKYVETNFLKEVLPLCREFEGRLAVVGLPCDITALSRRCMKEAVLSDKVVLTIALVCGHNSRTQLIDHVSKKLELEAGKELVDYRFRVGHWRGRIEAEFDDGSVLTKPTKVFNDYQNLFFFCERKCMACNDHYGYNADVSVGDIWLFRLKVNPIKHTAVITRNSAGEDMYNSVIESGAVRSSDIDVRSIMDGQSRIGPSHYNVSARYKVGKLLGIKLKDNDPIRVSWYSYLNAMITLLNIRMSEKQWGQKLIFSMPRSVLKFYLYFKKGLESLK